MDAVRKYLDGLADNTRRRGNTAQARTDLYDLGTELSQKALPQLVRQRIDELLPGAASLSIVTAGYHDVPWELLPAPGGRRTAAFLAERLPVLRRVPDQEYPRRLAIRDAAYVRPSSSPDTSEQEISGVRQALGPAVRHRLPAFATQADLRDYLYEGHFDLLHLACHNTDRRRSWSQVQMDDGPFEAFNLSAVSTERRLRERRPLVFFNACNSLGWVETDMAGWAQRFLDAGAGAFVGSTWAVRTASATTFATKFYAALRQAPAPSSAATTLGAAALAARLALHDHDGDPTRLAYAVYATPDSRIQCGP
jgi:hypothetical protein